MVDELTSYDCVSDFFNRRINLSNRGLTQLNNVFQHPAPQMNSIYAPADSVLSAYGEFSDQEVRQLTVKGLKYSLNSLLNQDNFVYNENSRYGYAVYYLSPGDYHDFVAPFNFQSQKYYKVNGDLWPVNKRFMSIIYALLAKNERIVVTGKWNNKFAAVVPVGALNVGSIVMDKVKITSNQWLQKDENISQEDLYACSENMGRFRFGSTVVVVFEMDRCNHIEKVKDGQVKLGEETLRILKHD